METDLLLNIKPTMLKELIKFIPIKRFLNIIASSKRYQTLFHLNSSTYQILYLCSQNKYNILFPKRFSEVFEGIFHRHKSASLDEIASGVCLYLISLKNSLRLKHIPVYLQYPELFIVYKKAASDFRYTFNVTVFPTDDNEIEYPDQSEAFINQYISFFEEITLMKPQIQSCESNTKMHLGDFCIKLKNTLSCISFANYKFTSKEKPMLDIINKCINNNCCITKCNMSHNSFCVPLLEIISKLDLNKALQSLKMSSSRLYNQSIDTLSQSHCYSKLTALNLSNNKIGNEGVMKLTNGYFPSLEKLNLSYNKISKEGIYHLSKESLIKLKTLILEGNNLIGAAKDLFNNTTTLINLTKLNVIDCQMTDNDFALMNENKLNCLKKLLISKNKDLGRNCLLFAMDIKSLEYIEASNTGFNLEDLLIYKEYSHQSLYSMVLSHNKLISSNGLIEIFKRAMFPNIYSIDLFNDNNINDTFIDFITENRPNKLEYINIDLNPLISSEKKNKCYLIYKKLHKYK